MDKKFASLVERLHPKFEILINMAPVTKELLSNLVYGLFGQAAVWVVCVVSIPSLKHTPVMTLAR